MLAVWREGVVYMGDLCAGSAGDYLQKREYPIWYRMPENQRRIMMKWIMEWGEGFEYTDIPPVPANVTCSSSQVLLLCAYLPGDKKINGIQRTFDTHLEIICQQLNQNGCRVKKKIKTSFDFLRIHPGKDHEAGIFWVIFDFESHKMSFDFRDPHGITDNLPEDPNRAGSEFLSALAMFPEWMPETGNKPIALFGYRYRQGDDWDNVPTISWNYFFGKRMVISPEPFHGNFGKYYRGISCQKHY